MWETMNRLIRADLPVGERSSFMDRKSCMRREGKDARSRPAQAGIPSVIPAQAGIQWLIQYIPALAGMTIH